MTEITEKTGLQEEISSLLDIKALHNNRLHLGHSASFRNPDMKEMIHQVRYGVCIINLVKTQYYLKGALSFIEKIVSKGGNILFVGTKPTASDIISELAQDCGMPYVNHRWLGGMLTNFVTVKQSITRLKKLSSMLEDGTIDKLTKKEALKKRREIDKLEKTLGGIKNINRLPDALVVFDVGYEDIAVKEARKLGIPVVGVVDTNNDPQDIQFVIPANDDAIRSIKHLMTIFNKTVKLAAPEKKIKTAPKSRQETEKKSAPPKRKENSATTAAVKEKAPSPAKTVTTEIKISAADVKKLREATSFAMMECKKALVEAGGDFEKAQEILAKSSKKKIEKKAERIAAEGVISLAEGEKHLSIIEINCETDFVARDENFINFKELVEKAASDFQIDNREDLLKAEVNGKSIETYRQEVISKVGENISLRRISTMLKDENSQGSYNHGGKMAAIVSLQGGTVEQARDLAMHIAAMNPQYFTYDNVPEEIIAKQEEIFTAQGEDDNKPAELKKKIVLGKVKKHFEAECLMQQSFIKNPDLTIEQYLKENKTTINAYIRYGVGEGIEKEVTDFAAEVLAQVKK